MKEWTPEELDLLQQYYPQKGKRWCASQLGRGEGSIRWMASNLGLKQDRTSEFFEDWQRRAAESKVGKKRPEQRDVMLKLHAGGKLIKTEEQRKAISERMKAWHKTHEHPKGAIGLVLSPEARARQSAGTKKAWRAKSPEEKFDISLRALKTKFNKGNYANMRKNVTWKGGKRFVGGKEIYFRSRWEANYARYLEWLKQQGEIQAWEHEPDVFWFTQIRRGCVSYLPDFKVTEQNGEIIYHEVKGWMDNRSKTKLKRMAKYYPNISINLINGPIYKSIEKQMIGIIEDWEI